MDLLEADGIRRTVVGLAGALALGACLLLGPARSGAAPAPDAAPPSNDIEPIASVCAGDIVPNGFVDVADLLALFSAWGNKGGKEDVNGDGIVDARDLIELLAGWGICSACPDCG